MNQIISDIVELFSADTGVIAFRRSGTFHSGCQGYGFTVTQRPKCAACKSYIRGSHRVAAVGLCRCKFRGFTRCDLFRTFQPKTKILVSHSNKNLLKWPLTCITSAITAVLCSFDSATVKRTRQEDPADLVASRQVSVTRSRPTRHRRMKRDTSLTHGHEHSSLEGTKRKNEKPAIKPADDIRSAG